MGSGCGRIDGIHMKQIDNDILEPFVKRSVYEVARLDKVVSIYFDYREKLLTFYVLVSQGLTDEEFEEIRVAQSEVLADFPYGEIEAFRIFECLRIEEELPYATEGRVTLGRLVTGPR